LMRRKLSKISCSSKGFTLMEALVAIIISSATAYASVPYVIENYHSVQKSIARQQLFSDIKLARSSALKKGTRTVITLNSTNTGYSIGYDYLPYSSTPIIEEKILDRKLPSYITLIFAQTILFSSSGFLISSDEALLTSSGYLMQNGSRYYTVTIYASGAIANG